VPVHPFRKEAIMNEEIKRANIGYGLDLSGDTFGPIAEFDDKLAELYPAALAIAAPTRDAFPWATDYVGKDERARMLSTYVFIPSENPWLDKARDWPEHTADHSLVAHGVLNGSDRDCTCHGEWVNAATAEPWGNDPADEAGPATRTWHATGNTMDEPCPDCNRCGGSGTVDSPGGLWALYEPRVKGLTVDEAIEALREHSDAGRGSWPLVHPGQAGDIYVDQAYADEDEACVVIADRAETLGSETGRQGQIDFDQFVQLAKDPAKLADWIIERDYWSDVLDALKEHDHKVAREDAERERYIGGIDYDSQPPDGERDQMDYPWNEPGAPFKSGDY
jgi:hypothetical protein